MVYFVVSVIVMSLFLTAMAIGVIMGRKPLKGSCGGLNRVMGEDEECEFCGKKEECEKRLKALSEQNS
jgi:hypothetical protein